MFTGLVQSAGRIVAAAPRPQGGLRLTVQAPLFKNAQAGDSIAHNGCCLTVTDPRGDQASFDLLEETLRLTNLGDLRAGDLVNLEPSLLPTDRLGGHFVTGHVDACGTIAFLGQEGADWRLDVAAPPEILALVVTKGCIAVDGMSLTVAELLPGGFRIWLIPHTLAVTNLAGRKVGERVNLETDLLAKYAAKLLRRE
ncbi:riboflavin synthase [bacterium]|jgi:riboflavin synthase|nr:riboflavin synthase [bacterium]